MEETGNFEIATIGGGCFWCLEAVYQQMEGIEKVESGYSGGHVENPSYREVCAKTTGHAEVVRLTFDPGKVSFSEILKVFWRIHDPTTLNRQGNDVGPQYRSVIYYHNDSQKEIAEKSKAAAEEAGIWDNPIMTEVGPLINYYLAEDYHQNYYRNNPRQGYCVFVVGPKVQKFQELFSEKMKVRE